MKEHILFLDAFFNLSIYLRFVLGNKVFGIRWTQLKK